MPVKSELLSRKASEKVLLQFCIASLTFITDFDSFLKMVAFFFTNSTDRWRACFCENNSLSADSAPSYFAAFNFSWLISLEDWVLSQIDVTVLKVETPTRFCDLVQRTVGIAFMSSSIGGGLCFMVVFHVSFLIKCLIINHCTCTCSVKWTWNVYKFYIQNILTLLWM
jgi:hypothetical protein